MSAVAPVNRNGSSENKSDAVAEFRVPRSAGRRETLEEKLKRLQAEIAARLQAIAARRKEEFREKEARLDRVIGAACRADKTMHENIRATLKSVKAPADRGFLKIEGWL